MNNQNGKAGLLESKQHFQLLDGLRGVAAIAVVVFHFMEIAVPDYHDSFIAHAYLAVDFFFCLSGFVVAYAYDQRLKQIGILTFLKLRLIRLHPLVIIGSIWGLIAFIFDPWSDLWMKYANDLWLMFTASCFMIPYPLVKERYFNLFHLNAPAWSLFWEYVVNIFYALVLVRVRNKVLWALVILAAGLLFWEAHLSKNLAVGWGGDTFRGGPIRVAFSFMAGVLVYRSGFIIKNRMNFPILTILLLATFVVPYNDWSPIIDPVLVVFCFPLLIMFGAGASLGVRYSKLCQLFGDISYPLYMIHYPFIWLFMSYVERYKPSLPEMTWITIVGTILLFALAYAVLKWMDEPIRKWLKRKWVKAKS